MSEARTTVITRETLALEDGALPLTVVRSPADGAAVVIMPSAFGVAADLEEQMRELATEASLVVAPDPFFRFDPGPAPYEDMARVRVRLQQLDREVAYGDLRRTLAWAREESRLRPVVMVGVCFGGPFALLAAADGAVDGVVTWHGTRMDAFLARAAEMRCPMHFHFGGADPFVPPEAVDAVRKAFAARSDVHLFVHEGATHGFSHPAAPQAYDARAERAAMASVLALVKQTSRR